MRRFPLILLTLMALPVLLPVLLLGVLLTPWGLGLAAGFVPGLRVEGISGPLPARLAVERLSLSDGNGAWLEVEGAEIRIAWREVFAGRLRLETVAARRLALHRLPPAAPTTGPAPLALPSLPHLPLAIRIGQLDLTRIELGEDVLGQSATLSLGGSLALEAARLSASLALQRLDQPGSARLDLALDRALLAARLNAAEPAGGLVAALAGMPDASFTLDLTLDGPASGAAWSLDATLGEAHARFTGEASLSPQGVAALSLTGSATPAGLLPLAGPVTMDAGLHAAPDGGLTLDRLALALPAGQLTAEGRLGADAALNASFRLQAGASENFAAWLPPGLSWRAIKAEGQVTGTLAAPALAVTLQAEAPSGLGEADALLGETLRLQAQITPARIEARLVGEWLEATLAGPILPPFDLAFTLMLRDPPGLSGAITAEGRLTGTAEAPQLLAELRADRLEGQGLAFEAIRLTANASLNAVRVEGGGNFQSRLLNLAIEASREGEMLRLDRLEARFAEVTLAGSGQGSLPAGPFTGALRLDAPDLARLELGLAGRLSAELAATAIAGTTGPAAQGLRLRLEGTGVGSPALRADLQAEAEGSLQALAFRLGLSMPEGAVNLAGDLGLVGEEARITLSRLEARAGADALTLAGLAHIRVNQAGDVALEPARLTSRRGGTLTLQGRVEGGQVNGRADLAAVPLGPLSGGRATGTASGQVVASGRLDAPQVEANLRVEGLRASAAPQLPPAQLTATARLQGQTLQGGALRAEARLTAGPAVQLDLTAQQPRGLGASQPFEAALRGRLDLGVLARPYLAAGADRVAGRVALDLRASGTPSEPALTGGATLSEASYANPIYGTRIDGIAARFTAQGRRLVVESFTGRTGGGGTVSLQGWVEPFGEGLPAEFQLRAQAARPLGGALGDAVLDAELQVNGPLLSGGSLAGRVNLRRAELRIPESLASSVPSLAPVRQIGPLPPGRPAPAAPPPAVTAPRLPMALDVTITAPRAIFIRGRGLEAELSGELKLGGTVAAPIPSGGFRLRRGSYDLAGRRLEFSRGIIGFDSANFSPSLDFLASARSRTHTINLTITGTPATPRINVTAEPELPQDEALARLLFDRETGRLSPFEILTITQAAAQLAGLPTPGLGAVDRLRRGLGLDHLGVGSDGGGRSAVQAGGYVAPGVYLGIRQGTAGGTPGVGVQVELAPRLRLEAETSTGPAGDRLGITWEREY